MKKLFSSTNNKLSLLAFTALAICALMLLITSVPNAGEASRLRAPDAPTYVFNTYLNGGPGFTTPFGIARDAQGRVFVADGGKHEIHVFNSANQFVASFGDTRLQFPYGVAVDANGNIYVSDYDLNKIFKFDASFNFIKSWGGKGTANGKLDKPAGIAVMGNRVYVVEVTNHRVQIFDLDGVFVKKFGAYGTTNGKFFGPYGIAVDAQGNVYVADTGNHRIQKFNKKGKWRKTWGGKGKQNGQFNYPRMMALNNAGHLFVADEKNHRVQIFDKNGVFLSKFGKKGTSDGKMKNPVGVVSDSSGMLVYVSEKITARVSLWCNTACATVTPTQTFTPSITNTPTNTWTVTPGTPTQTYTPTYTRTFTPTSTNTPTFTPTLTPSVTPTLTPSCAPLPSGAISWWRAENNASDVIGSNHGSAQNGATYGIGKVGQAFSFDGVNDFVVVPVSAGLNPSTITVEAWVVVALLPETGEFRMPVGNYDAAFGGWHIMGMLESGTLHPAFTVARKPNIADSAYSPQAISLNTWVHLAGTYDGNIIKIFVNGIEQDATNFAGGYSASTIDMRIGAASWADRGFVPGLVDELTIYNRALSASEIASIYNAGSLGKCMP